MSEILKEIILEGQAFVPNEYVKRDLSVSVIEKKASILIGVRRCGKSTYLLQYIEDLLRKGVAQENILAINFFDDRLHFINHTNLTAITDTYYSIYPNKKNLEKIYCFFDEIQVVSGWEVYIERLLRTENCEIVITGSSAKMLSREIATQMRGRSLSWEIFPFSFLEFLRSNNIEVKKPINSPQKYILTNLFDKYFKIGGFPEVQNVGDRDRVKIHQEYFRSVLFRDIIERHNLNHPKAILYLAHHLIDNIGQLYSINRLVNFLKTAGYKTSKTFVSEIVDLFEDAYFLFTVRKYDESHQKQQVNPKKVYCIDHALVNSVSSGINENEGALLENLVFLYIRRLYSEIYYYKTAKDQEVDFLVIPSKGSKFLVQICKSIQNEKTRKRELSAIATAMAELQVEKCILLTLNEYEEIQLSTGVVSVMPIWKYILNQTN